MKMTGKTGREAGGTLKEPSFVFMVAACWTENVESCARQQLSIMVEVKIGKIFNTILASSTCLTVQFSCGWLGLLIVALFRNSMACVGIGIGIGLFSFSTLCLCSSRIMSVVVGSEDTELVDIFITTLLQVLVFPLLKAAEAKTCQNRISF